MNDDKKQPLPDPGAPPADDAEDNPWDDDDGGGRTLATDGPSFELPSNIPSPITVPPPPMPSPPMQVQPLISAPPMQAPPQPQPQPRAMPALNKKNAKATMMGFGPPGPALPSAPAAPASPGAAAPMNAQLKATQASPGNNAPFQPTRTAPVGFAPMGKPIKPIVAPLGGSTLQHSPPPPSSPDLSGAAAAAIVAGPPSSARRAPPLPPRPAGGAPSPPRPAGAPSSARMPLPPPASSRMPTAQAVDNDADELSDLAAAAAPSLANSQPVPAAAPGPADDEWSDSEQEDGPTMAIASPVMAGGRALRDDLVNPRHSPMASTGYAGPHPGAVDKDAETMALDGDDLRLPPIGHEVEETTRAVSREEMMRHQDAHVIVGDDAHGDEATLAVAPGALEGLGIGAALAQALQAREEQHGQHGQHGQYAQQAHEPAFPPPPQHFQQNVPPPGGGSSGHLQAAHPHGQHPGGMGMQPPQSWGGEASPASYQQGPPSSQQGMGPGFDPMLPGSGMQGQMHGGYPPSGQQPVQQTHPMNNANAQNAFGPASYPQPQQPQPHHGQGGPNAPAPWITQPTPPPTGMSGPSRFTPQIILLVAVGAVCLAIFVIGIVLFVTTKF